MLHQIKRCAAPCTGEVTLEEYDKLIGDAQDFLTGKSDRLRKRLQNQMREESANLNFEKAAEYRDRLQALSHVSGLGSNINPTTFKEGDVIGIHSEGGQSCIQVFFFRSGLNWGNSSHFPRHSKDETPAQIVDAFIAQF